jgi:hypothetical protein
MFGRKAKDVPEPAPQRRQVQRGNMSPAFSYYTSRASEPVERTKAKDPKRTPDKREQKPQVQPQKPEAEKEKSASRSVLASISFWLLLIVIVVCVGKMLILSTDPKIVIVGKTVTSSSYLQSNATYEAAAEKILNGSVANRTKLTVDAEGLSQRLKEEFPELEDVSISIPLVNSRPVVYIQPADPSLVAQTTQGNYALSKSGYVLTALQSLPSGVPVVVDQSGLVPRLGKPLMPSSTVSFVQTVLYQLNAAHLPVTAFVLPGSSPYELDVRLEGKPYMIKFNLEADALTQSGAAIATIQQLGGTVPANYIDVRVPGRVYYK